MNIFKRLLRRKTAHQYRPLAPSSPPPAQRTEDNLLDPLNPIGLLNPASPLYISPDHSAAAHHTHDHTHHVHHETPASQPSHDHSSPATQPSHDHSSSSHSSSYDHSSHSSPSYDHSPSIDHSSHSSFDSGGSVDCGGGHHSS